MYKLIRKAYAAALTLLIAVSPDLTPAQNTGSAPKASVSGFSFGDTTVIYRLFGKFRDNDAAVRAEAMEELAGIGEDAVPVLCEGMQDTGEQVRLMSSIALCRMRGTAVKAVPYLIRGVYDSSIAVKLQCVYALRYFGKISKKVMPALEDALKDKDALIRKTALASIRSMRQNYPEKAADIKYIIAKSDSMIPALQKELNVPGVSIVIIRKNKTVYSADFGTADIRTNKPVNGETMFEACSMSKPVFAYMVMGLVDMGRLDLDKPAWEYYDDPAFMGQPERKKITARMLLSHTSGLPNWRPGEEDNEGLLPILFEPGLKFSYSGEGMFYLQKIIEKITGMPFDEYARQTLFDQLGMKHSTYIYKKDYEDNIAAGHDENGMFRKKTSYPRANAGYSLYCSADDYALFLTEMMATRSSGKYSVKTAGVYEMLKRQVIANIREPVERPGNMLGFEVYWGLGWGINTTAYEDIYYHSGANGSGFRCYSQFNPKDGSGIVIMTNGLSGDELWKRVIREIGDL